MKFPSSPTPPVEVFVIKCIRFFMSWIRTPAIGDIANPPISAGMSEKSSLRNAGNIGIGNSRNIMMYAIAESIPIFTTDFVSILAPFFNSILFSIFILSLIIKIIF